MEKQAQGDLAVAQKKRPAEHSAPVALDRGDALGLPLPRLQLTWANESHGHWLCHYELLIPVQKFDIRNESGRGYIALPIGITQVGSERGPVLRDGTLDAPFRDGAHAKWDSDRLGGIPIFTVYGSLCRRLGDSDARRSGTTENEVSK